MKAYFFGPTTNKKVIKFANVNVRPNIEASARATTEVTVQPGLTAQGVGTTDITKTVSYANINIDDDWDYIVQISDA